MTTILTTINMYYPPSYYFHSGYLITLAERLTKISKDNQIESVQMNEDTFDWLFGMFTDHVLPDCNPLSIKEDNKYFTDHPIIIDPEFRNEMIQFNIIENNKEK